MRYPAYPAYKDSGIEWLGDVPERWDVSRIKFIVSTPVTDGPHETPEILSEGIPFVSAEAINHGRINFDKIRGHITEEDHLRFSRKYCPKQGDIYMVKSGATTGRVAMVEDNRVFNIWSPLAAIRCSENLADKRFVYHFMHSREFQTAVQLSWSFGTQQNIGMGVIQNIAVPLPTTSEQHAIADFLDVQTAKVDALLAKKRELIDKLKEKRTALISRTVTRGLPPLAARAAGLDLHLQMKSSGIEWLGEVPEHWEVKRLSYLAFLKSGENITSEQLDDEGEYPVYGGNGLRGYFHRYTHEGNYALIGRQGALCGNINYAAGKFWASEHAIVVNPLTDFVTGWLGEVLRAMNLNQYSISAAQPGLSVSTIGALKIPVPPQGEQQAIADFLDRETLRIDRMVVKVEEAIERLQEYRAALITAAVTGKIDVRGANA